MSVPLAYNIRNLRVRWVSSILTALCITAATVIFLLLAAMSVGIERSLVGTGDPLNVIAMRTGVTAESQSLVTKKQVDDLLALKGVARDATGELLMSPELVVVAALPRIGKDKANAALRGVGPRAKALRPNLQVTEGRWFKPALGELVVGAGVASRFPWIKPGSELKFKGRTWKVVGLFSDGGQAYESEIWGDLDDFKAEYKREASAVLFRVERPGDVERVSRLIKDDKQFNLDARPQAEYFKSQNLAGGMMMFVSGIMGFVLSIGAIFGVANTMYAAVISRTREIATMRVLGFTRMAIWSAFVLESGFLGLVGGIVGAALAYVGFNNFATGTVNWMTFSDMAFKFQVTPTLMVAAVIMAVLMGLGGGLLPAWRASTVPIARALRGL
ncbi:MAG TPA: FtsX-like permease family protein [Planctomycetota bacterium]